MSDIPTYAMTVIPKHWMMAEMSCNTLYNHCIPRTCFLVPQVLLLRKHEFNIATVTPLPQVYTGSKVKYSFVLVFTKLYGSRWQQHTGPLTFRPTFTWSSANGQKFVLNKKLSNVCCTKKLASLSRDFALPQTTTGCAMPTCQTM